MAEFEGYRSELIEFVKRSGRVSAEDLVRWARDKGLTMLTLYILVEEVLETGELRGSGDKRVIDEIFNLEIPSTLEPAQPAPQLQQPALTKRAPATSHAERREKARGRRRAVAERGSLLKFIAQEREEQPLPEKGSAERPEAGGIEEGGVQQEPVESSLELAAELRELLADEDLVKAVRYLERYWSVGKLRLIEDLENMGVKDPRRVLEDLLRRGLVEVVEPGIDGAGVVNAKEELIELAKRVRPSSTQLSEVFRRKD
ncbi:MAG: hypothetical protein QW650_07980 [Thermofilum sp.]